MMRKFKNDKEEEFEFDHENKGNRRFIKFVGRLLDNWYKFGICAILGVFFSLVYIYFANPSYKIRAKLLVSDEKKGGGMLSSTALGDLSSLMGTKNSVDNEVEVLKTSDLMRQMVIKENAYINYYVDEKMDSKPTDNAPFTVELLSSPDSILAPQRFEVSFLADQHYELVNTDTALTIKEGQFVFIPEVGTIRMTRISQKPLSGVYSFEILPLRDAIDQLNAALRVDITNKNVSTIDLILEYPLPERGTKMLKSLIDKYVQQNLFDKNVIADSTLSFINARLSKITSELADVENNISGYKKQTQLTDISEQSRLLLENTSFYHKNLAELEIKLASLDALDAYLKDQSNLRVLPSSIVTEDLTFVNLIAKYNELILHRERLLLANTEDNPLVVNLDGQISGVREDMISNLASTRRGIEFARNKQRQVTGQLSSQIQNVPTIERGYIDLARLQQIKQAQYVFLQEKWEETAIGRTANVSNSRVIDSPKADKHAFAPNKKIVFAIGLFAGLIFPFLGLYIGDLLNVRVQSLEDLSHLQNLPIVGMIGHSNEQEQIVVSRTSRSVIVEQFRALRTNLEFALSGRKTILFTSSMSGEGKSFIAANLALALALLNKKVLLMELDLRKPSLSSKLDIFPGLGFSQYIVKPEIEIEDIIVPSGKHEYVDIVRSGIIPPNPSELLIQPRAKDLVDYAVENYDYILIDAPPVGMVTDAQLLSQYADICLYVIRQGVTFKEQLQIPHELSSQNKMCPIHLVVNDIKTKSSYYNGYGYGYGYGYHYGYEIEKISLKDRILKRFKNRRNG